MLQSRSTSSAVSRVSSSLSLAAGRQTSQAIFSDLAIKAGQVLLGQLSDPRRPHRQILEGRKWPLSFAHGRAGIAYSLIKLYYETGHKPFEVAAVAILEQELAALEQARSALGERAPDHAAAVASQLAWCHGKPGVALALKAASNSIPGSKIEEIVRALTMKLASSRLERSDCLCHGNFGNLLIVRELTDWRPTQRTYSGLEKKVLRRISRNGLVCGNFGLETGGLMEGLAGIGLGLLKLAEPDRVPNVLILETIV